MANRVVLVPKGPVKKFGKPTWKAISSFKSKPSGTGPNKTGKYPCKKCDFVGTKPGQLGGHQKVHRTKAQRREEAIGGVRPANAKLKSYSSTKASVTEKVRKPKKYTPALRTVIKALSKPSPKPAYANLFQAELAKQGMLAMERRKSREGKRPAVIDIGAAAEANLDVKTHDFTTAINRSDVSRKHIESLIREHEYKVGQLKSVLSML